MPTIRELLVSIGVNVDDRKLDKFEDQLGRAKASAGDLVGRVRRLALGATAAAGSLAAAGVASAIGAEEAARNAATLGLNVEAYQELAGAADLAGLGTEGLGAAFGILTDRAAEAAAGGKGAADALRAIGLGANDLKGLGPERTLEAVADGLAAIEDPQRRLAAAQDVFGKRLAVDVLPLLARGADGLRSYRAEVRATGIVTSEAGVKRAAEFSRNLRLLRLELAALASDVGDAVIPKLDGLVTTLRTLVVENKAAIVEWAETASNGFDLVEEAIRRADKIAQSVGGWDRVFLTVAGGAGLVGLIKGGKDLYDVIVAVRSAMLLIAGPVAAATGASLGTLLLIVGAVAAAFVAYWIVIDDVTTFLRGGDSALGRFLDRFREAEGPVGAFARLLQAGIEFAKQNAAAFYDLAAAAGELGGQVRDVLAPSFEPMLEVMRFIMRLGFGVFVEDLTRKIEGFTLGLQKLAELRGGAAVGEEQRGRARGTDVVAAAAGDLRGAAAAMPAAQLERARATGLIAQMAFAPTAGIASAVAQRGVTVTVQGDHVAINGVGASVDEIRGMLEAHTTARLRKARAAFAGGEV